MQSQSLISSFHTLCTKGDIVAISSQLTPDLLNSQDKRLGLSPLANAVMSAHEESVEFLLSQGAKPNLANNMGEAPLHYAADNSLEDIASLLLDYGADPNASNHEGETPLFHSAYRGDIRMTDLLLRSGAKVGKTCKTLGRSPLHYAVIAGHLECVLLLLQYKADPNLKDMSGLTPIDLASPELDLAMTQPQMLSVIEEAFTEEDCKSPVKNESHQVVVRRLIEETGEPDSELAEIRSKELHSLYDFLTSIDLQEYFENLTSAGYDDLDSLAEQMITPVPLNEDMLRQIGICKPGHRKKLLMKLHYIAYGEPPKLIGNKRRSLWQCCATNITVAPKFTKVAQSVEEWLGELRLHKLHSRFIDAGFDDIEHMRELMLSPFPITEEVLKDEVFIEKPGHRFRVLGKLLHDVKITDVSIYDKPGCEMCLLL